MNLIDKREVKDDPIRSADPEAWAGVQDEMHTFPDVEAAVRWLEADMDAPCTGCSKHPGPADEQAPCQCDAKGCHDCDPDWRERL